MRFHDDEKTALRVNEHVSLRGIPAAAHTYQVNGRTPLEWFIDRYRIHAGQGKRHCQRSQWLGLTIHGI